jgi:ParB family transcriptional regulator, chromosome partitioning protein
MVDRRLGRGLDFFLSGGRNTAPNPAVANAPGQRPGTEPPAEAPAADGSQVVTVPIGELTPGPFQPRKALDEDGLKPLAESIRASGILQPILARKDGARYQIVAGERRWRAAQLAGLTEVPVLVRPLTDEESAVFGLVENLQREDLNAIEKAQGLRVLMDKLAATQEQVAKQVGLERSTVANFLRLLDLPNEVQAHVSRGTLSMGHARSLLALPDAETMVKTADLALRQSLSVRALEAKVKELLEASKGEAAPSASAPAKSKTRPVWLKELEENLVEALSTTVSIRYGRKRSQIVIECAGREEFERIFARLKNC